MARRKARFTLAEIRGAFKAAKDAGYDKPRIEVDLDGRMTVIAEAPSIAPLALPALDDENPWDAIDGE